jgi:hypothetical protein
MLDNYRNTTADDTSADNGPRLPQNVIINRPPYVVSDRVAPSAAPTRAPARTAAPVAAPTCLAKEYLQSGVVLFKDVCTKEWAMNSTSATDQVGSASRRGCMTKEYPQAGVVFFRDTCTNEWAMNPPQQQVQIPQGPQTQ